MAFENTNVSIEEGNEIIIIGENTYLNEIINEIIYNGEKIHSIKRKKEESPIEEVKEGLIFLEKSSVDFIAIPCVTVHYFFDQLISAVNTPVLNLVEETASFIKENYPFVKKVGLLATKGTFKGQIFEKIFRSGFPR